MSGAIYARLSKDDGTSASIERQIEAAQKMAGQKGIEITEIYSETVSAFSGVQRPEYDRLCSDIRSGEIKHVFVFKLDRLFRKDKERADFVHMVREMECQFFSVNDQIDTSTAAGRMILGLLGSLAEEESETKSIRIKAEREQRAKRGLPKGGPRPFGYEKDHVTINPVEAFLIQEACQRVISGEALNAICRDWAARGVKTSTGKPQFGSSGLRKILTSYRIAGIREHLGEPVAKAIWDPIVSDETLEAVRSAINVRKQTKKLSYVSRTFMLKGLIHCSNCGYPMQGNYKEAGKGQSRYQCQKQANTSACGKMSVRCLQADETVWALMAERAEGVDLSSFLKDEEGIASLLGEQAKLQEREKALAHDFYVNERLSEEAFQSAADALSEKRREIEKRISKLSEGNFLLGLDAQDLVSAWDEKPIIWRAQAVRVFIRKIAVLPGKRGHFSAERLQINWKS